MAPDDAEYAVLTTGAGERLLAELEAIRTPLPADIERLRKIASVELVSAALRLTEARRRGSSKFERAAGLWLDPVGTEQATSEVVARHKASRFESQVVVDLCAGIGGDSVQIGSRSRFVFAVDRDRGMTRRIAWNSRVYGVERQVQAIRCSAETFPRPADAMIHIDPDRRSGLDRRARSIQDYDPSPEVLHRLVASTPGGAIKLGPASDFETHFRDPQFEIELISLAGECKEATAWFGELATCRRRATVLPEGVTWTDRDGGDSLVSVTAQPAAWIFDPDPSLRRSGLLDGFAVAHGLTRLDPSVDLLTGPDRVRSPFLMAFHVREILPLDIKRLRRLVAGERLGPLEIKTRGLDLSPESLRARLRPTGPNPATLILFAGREGSLAVWCDREG